MKKSNNTSKPISKQKRLILRRETIVLLDPPRLGGVASGIDDVTGGACDTVVSKTSPCDP
jgi:hypothetical protein